MWKALWDNGQMPVQWSVVIGASLVAAFWDVRTGRIPNVLTAPLWLAGMVYAAAVAGLPGLADACLASILLATPYIWLFAFAGGGGGDAKLMAAVGSWLGLVQGTVALFFVAMAGVVISVAALVAHRIRQGRVAHLGDKGGLVQPGNMRNREIPYGLAILTGVLVAATGVTLWRM
jgi:Flp pilus assembly protein protease CpaA